MIHDVHRCLMLDMLDDDCCCWWWRLSGGGLGWRLKLRRWLKNGPYLSNSSGSRVSIHLYFTVSCFQKFRMNVVELRLVDLDHQVRSEKNGGFNKVISVGGNAVSGNVGDNVVDGHTSLFVTEGTWQCRTQVHFTSCVVLYSLASRRERPALYAPDPLFQRNHAIMYTFKQLKHVVFTPYNLVLWRSGRFRKDEGESISSNCMSHT